MVIVIDVSIFAHIVAVEVSIAVAANDEVKPLGVGILKHSQSVFRSCVAERIDSVHLVACIDTMGLQVAVVVIFRLCHLK